MPNFTIREIKPATLTWIFEVEADSEEQALQMVMDGRVEISDFQTNEHDWEESEYEIEEAE